MPVYAKQCPHCHALNGPTAIVCGSCQGSLKGIPLSHGGAAQAQPRFGRRWDLVIFTLLGGALLAALAVLVCGLVEQVALGVALGMITAAVAVVLAGIAAAPLRPLDEDQQWGTSALFVLVFLLAILAVLGPVICLGLYYFYR